MTISVSSAVGAGFNVIGQRPLSVAAWGLFANLAAFALFALGFTIVGLPVLTRLITSGAAPTPDQAAQMALGVLVALWPALLIVAIGMLFVSAVVQGAAIRSILQPDQRSYASMRFGRQEGALVLLFLLYIPLIWVVAVVSILAIGGAVAVARAIHGAGGGLVGFLLCLAYAMALMWVSLRFSLAAPMTFAEGRVRFFRSWELTRGQGGALFGLAWLMVLVWMAVFAAYTIVSSIVNALSFGAVMASVITAAGGAKLANDPSALFPALLAAWPVLAVAYIPAFLLSAAFTGVTQAIAQGPWADVYRQLKGSPDVSAAFI
jgi:hypothetical protein